MHENPEKPKLAKEDALKEAQELKESIKGGASSYAEAERGTDHPVNIEYKDKEKKEKQEERELLEREFEGLSSALDYNSDLYKKDSEDVLSESENRTAQPYEVASRMAEIIAELDVPKSTYLPIIEKAIKSHQRAGNIEGAEAIKGVFRYFF